eukprot:TRINITY_DN1136_c0_g1_i1.p1 TRINITY_DN1136_c0_g1~~TRINITY_DN1136_c0_g1_i1.p1  ORF type:complete len:468 (-),score=173.07 TRINITY_DN1136_c0_g1_i1:171-1574(-)
MLCCFHGNDAVLRQLLERMGRSQIFVADKQGRNALHYVAISHAPEEQIRQVCRILLGKGGRVDVSDTAGVTAVHLAAQHGNMAFFDALFSTLAKIEYRYFMELETSARQHPLHLAVAHQMEQVIDVLLDNGTSVNSKDGQNRTPLHYAVCCGNHSIVKRILQQKPSIDEVDSNYRTPLVYAAERGVIQLVETLLFAGANVFVEDNKGRNALFHCVLGLLVHSRSGNQELLKTSEACVRAIHNAGGELTADISGKHVLHVAAGENDPVVVSLLLDMLQKDLISIRDAAGRTPLHTAAMLDASGVASVLLEDDIRCLSMCAQSGALWTAVHFACAGGAQDTLRNLLSFCDENEERELARAPDKHQRTPLHLAASAGSAACCTILLEYIERSWNGAAVAEELQRRDANGRTPLHRAVRKASAAAASALLDAASRCGASIVSAVDANGESPVDRAKARKRPKLHALLAKHL